MPRADELIGLLTKKTPPIASSKRKTKEKRVKVKVRWVNFTRG